MCNADARSYASKLLDALEDAGWIEKHEDRRPIISTLADSLREIFDKVIFTVEEDEHAFQADWKIERKGDA